MNRVSATNGAALIGAIVLTVTLARSPARPLPPAQSAPSARPATRLVDATGVELPRRRYRRIVSTNLVTDRLLLELAEPERILAFSTAAAERSRDGFRYAGKPTVDGFFGPIEKLIALAPDLVVSNSFGTPGRAHKLRAAGIEVFELGELRGTASLVRVAETLGDLLGQPERGRRFAAAVVQRMNNVAAGLGQRPRRRALFLSVIGSQVRGGTTGTALHDILTAAGLLDVAAQHFRDWPAYSAEQLIALDPEVIVTRAGTVNTVCSYPGMDRLLPCREPGHILELPGELLDEPGPAMLEAAEELHRLAYQGQ